MSIADFHPSVESLSSYLDSELRTSEALEIERHLAECGDCRVQLDGLRRVVSGLHSFERIAPPAFMEQSILQHVSLEGARRRNRHQRFLRLLAASGRGNVALGFALVFSLVVIVYLFVSALSNRTEIVVPARGTVVFEDTLQGRTALVSERLFRLAGARWEEEGLDQTEEPRVPGSESRAELLEELPWLATLLEGGDVILAHEGEVLIFERGL